MASLLHGEKESIPPRLTASEDRSRRRVIQGSRTGSASLPSWFCDLLQIPLELKLLSANLMITVVAVLVLLAPVRPALNRLLDAIIVVGALGIGSLVNFALVRFALRPLHNLTKVAWLVSQGLLGARVPLSITADRQLTQLSVTINALLDDLVEERAKTSKFSREPVNRALGVARSIRTLDAPLSRPAR